MTTNIIEMLQLLKRLVEKKIRNTQMSRKFISPVPLDRIDELMHLYKNEWWTKTRPKEEVLQLLQNSTFTFGIIDVQADQLIAFTRVLSDRLYKAIIFDVIVNPEYRGLKLGAQIIEEVIHFPALKNIESIELYCKPQHKPFYEKFGFESMEDVFHFMRLKR